MATTEATGLRVDLAGRSARVEVRPDEGLSELRDRVADAFGLTASFDLLNSQGVPLRSDMDKPFSRADGAIVEVTVDAGEEILVDLERAHEETGAIRWVMLRRVLAGLRRQVAEVFAGVADTKHRAAILDEQLMREKSSRESGDAASAAELRKLALRLETQMNHNRTEGQTALEASIAQLHEHLQDSLAGVEAKCLQAVEAVKQELQMDKGTRQVVDGEVSNHFQQVQAAVQQEAEVRAKELQQLWDTNASLQASLEHERSERMALEAKADKSVGELDAKLAKEHSARMHDVDSMKGSLGEARQALREEGLLREQALEEASKHIKETAVTAEAKMDQHQAELHERLDHMAALEGMVIELTDRERGRREIGMAEMARAIEDFSLRIAKGASEHDILEECLKKDIAAAFEVAEKARSALAEKLEVQHGRADTLQAHLDAEQKARSSGFDSARKECQAVREEIEQGRQELKETCKVMSASEAAKREEGLEEVLRIHKAHGEEQRQWASMLIEQLSKDLRMEHEANVNEYRRRGEELANQAAESVKVEVMAEVNRIESSAAELMRARDSALAEERGRQENEAQQTATEVRDCLTSHSDFMEALEREQQILINRLNEGLSAEDQKREGLDQRIHTIEWDMQKVKGHLPILFAVPTAFR